MKVFLVETLHIPLDFDGPNRLAGDLGKDRGAAKRVSAIGGLSVSERINS